MAWAGEPLGNQESSPVKRESLKVPRRVIKTNHNRMREIREIKARFENRRLKAPRLCLGSNKGIPNMTDDGLALAARTSATAGRAHP